MAVDVVEIWRFEMLGGLRVVLPGGEGVTRFQTERAGALLAYLIYHRNREHPRDLLADLLWPDADRDAGRQRLRVVLHSLRRLIEPPKLTAQAGGGGLILSTRLTIGINPRAPVLTDVDELQAVLTALETGESEASLWAAEINRLYIGPLLPYLYEDWVLEERERLSLRVSEALRHNHNAPHAPLSQPTPSLPAPISPSLPRRRRLPASLTRFWGRESEIEYLLPLLAPRTPERLITLTGLGGVGKTRLALAVTEQAAEQYSPENVVFVPLNDLTDPELIIEEIARRLTVTVRSGEDTPAAIVNALRGEPALLLLDNLEHLLSETDKSKTAKVIDLIHDLMERLPTATFLTTSRQRLGIEVESVFPVSPLPVPSSDLPLAELLQNDSIRLFTDRARSVRPDFAVTAHGANAVAALCVRLEGIPLALELAAAWASLLTPTQMLERLVNGEARVEKELLTSRHQDRAARHQTLNTALRWSVERLPEALLRFWIRLTVFRGGWTTESAEAVCRDETQTDTIQKLAELQDRSLILSSTSESVKELGLRFRMLEAVRQYGREIMTPDEKTQLQDRHLAFFSDLAEAQALQLIGQNSIHALQILDAEYPNLTAALEYALRIDSPVGDMSGLRLAAALSDYWLIRGRLREGKHYLTEVVRRIDISKVSENQPKIALIDAWQGLGSLAQACSDLPEAYSHYEKALHLSCDIDDQKRIASQHNNLGLIDELEGRFDEAVQQHQASLALRRKNGDRRGEASSLNNLGVLKQNQRDYEAARRFYRESLKIKQELGEKRPLASAYNNLGNVSHALEDYPEAEYYQLQSLALRRELGDRLGIAASLNNLGRIAESMGNLANARSLYAESLAVKRDLGDSLGVARSLYNLARLALDALDYFEARRSLEECLSILRQATTNRKDISAPIYLLARLASLQQDHRRTALLCGACDSLLMGVGITRTAEEQKEYESLCALSSQFLGVNRFATLHRKGQKASVEEIFRIALREEY
jgi:predicted ATPase/DNA-binding SARP family transcriptional activator